MQTKFWSENVKVNHSEHLDERIISELILEKSGGKFWTGFFWLKIGASGGNEISGSIRCGEFLD
jgi:hypothetical protein